jgi:hypothetical protein
MEAIKSMTKNGAPEVGMKATVMIVLLGIIGIILIPISSARGGEHLIANPSSWWARRFYGPKKMQRAIDRFGAVSS